MFFIFSHHIQDRTATNVVATDVNDYDVRFSFVDCQQQLDFWYMLFLLHTAVSLPPNMSIDRQTQIHHPDLSRVAERVLDK